MFKSFLPKEYNFFEYFEQHIQTTQLGALEFLNYVKENKNLDEYIKKIKELEREADIITHKCTNALHITFITPIERTSIFRLIKQLDNIIDNLYGTINRFSLYDIQDMRPEAIELAQLIYESTILIEDALKGLRNMKNTDNMDQKCTQIRELENQADDIYRDGLSKLFRGNDVMSIIKWKEVLERLERAMNCCENVANLIETIVIEAA